MDQVEYNCNANIGEAVAAGIEEIRASTMAAGRTPRDAPSGIQMKHMRWPGVHLEPACMHCHVRQVTV